MPRRNGSLRSGSSKRESVARAFRELERPAPTPARASGSAAARTMELMASRGLWFWIAAALFGVAIGLLISREPTRRR